MLKLVLGCNCNVTSIMVSYQMYIICHERYCTYYTV